MFDLDRWQEIFYTLGKHKLRTVLTAFGVFWGIFMLVMLLGMGNSLQQGVFQQFGGHTNTVWVWPASTTKIPYQGLSTGRWIAFKEGDLAAIRELPELRYSSGINNLNEQATVVVKNKNGAFQVRGLEPDIFIMSNITITAGRAINAFDFAEQRKVAVIGERVKEVLFEPSQDPIGQRIEIKGVNFSVIGVFKGNPNDRSDPERILLPNSTLRTTFNQLGWIGYFQLAPYPEIDAQILEEKVKNILMERHNIHPEDRSVIGSYNAQEEFDKVKNLFFGIKIFSWFVAIGSILAGMVGIANIMLIIVKERTREIGVHKALGATSQHIIGTIVLETLFLTVVAGYLGLAAAVYSLEGLTKVLQSMQDVNLFAKAEIDFTTALVALAILIASGVLAAVFPALRAAKVDPIVALQDE